MGLTFRKLRADEIDCRVQSVTEKGLILLLYKDARCDMNILDETVGPENWQRHHEVIKENLFCSVGIYFENRKDWVWKQDVGTESLTEKEKGEASDSFKRACFNWGIGRELYTAPFVFINKTDCNIVQRNGKHQCFDKFIVNQIAYDNNGRICDLSIVNTKSNVVVYKMGKAVPKGKKTASKEPLNDEPIDLSEELATPTEKKTYIELCKAMNLDATEILKKTGWTSGLMTKEHHGRALIILRDIENGKEQ